MSEIRTVPTIHLKKAAIISFPEGPLRQARTIGMQVEEKWDIVEPQSGQLFIGPRIEALAGRRLTPSSTNPTSGSPP